MKTLSLLIAILCATYSQLPGQSNRETSTILLFRTFNLLDYTFSYKIYMNDSLLGQMKTKSVYVIDTDREKVSFHATTKAPSLNADKRTNYRKVKKIDYPIALNKGQVHFVKCGFYNVNLFDLPRQPMLKLLKPRETAKYLRKGFIEKRIKEHLYEKWLEEHGLRG